MLFPRLFVVPHPGEILNDSVEIPESFLDVCRDIAASDVHCLVFVHMHGGIHPDSVTFHIPEAETFDSGLLLDRPLAAQIQTSLHDYERKTSVLEESEAPLPLLVCQKAFEKGGNAMPQVVSVGTSLEGAQRQYEVGSLMARALRSDQEPVAVVIAGQLSHCLTKESEAGYVPGADEYDAFVRDCLESSAYEQLMLYDPIDLELVGESLFRPLCVGLGLVDALQRTPKWRLTSYETPLGVGRLTGILELSD